MRDLSLWRLLKAPTLDADAVLPLLRELGEVPIVERAAFLGWLGPIAEHDSARMRAAAMSCLAGAHGYAAFRWLVAGLADGKEDVRTAALEALRVSCKEGDPLRWAHALFHPRPEVRRAAIDPKRPFPGDWHLKLHLLADDGCRDQIIAEVEERGGSGDLVPLLFHLLRGGLMSADRVRRLTRALPYNAWLSFLRPLLPRTDDLTAPLAAACAFGPAGLPPAGTPDRCDEMLALFWDDSEPTFFARLTDGAVAESNPFRQWLTLKLLSRAAQAGRWPQAALDLVCVLHPWQLACEWLPREQRVKALDEFYRLGSRCPRSSGADLIGLFGNELFWLRGHEGVPDLYAMGALLHAFDAQPYKLFLDAVAKAAIHAAVRVDFERSVSLLRVPDRTPEGRQKLLNLLTSEADARGPEMLALLAATVPADQLDFLDLIDGGTALAVFRALLVLEAERPRALSENKVHRLGGRLAGKFAAAHVAAFLSAWLTRPAPQDSALAATVLARLCHEHDNSANIVPTVVALSADELARFLDVLPSVPGFPYDRESELAHAVRNHGDARVRQWAAKRLGVTAAPEAPKASTVRTGTCAALATTPAGPNVGHCAALLASRDPLGDVITQFTRFSAEDDAFIKALDCEMVRLWRGQMALPFLGHAWLYRWDEHQAQVSHAMAGTSGGLTPGTRSPAGFVRWVLELKAPALARRLMHALAGVLDHWRWHANDRWKGTLTSELADALLDALTTPLAELPVKRLAVWKDHGANAALRDALNRLTLMIADLPPEIVRLLGSVIDVRGVTFAQTAGPVSRDVAAFQSIDDLVRLARDPDDTVAAPAARRLLMMSRQGAEALAGVLDAHPDRTWPLALLTELAAAPKVVKDALRRLILSPRAVPRVRFRLTQKLYPRLDLELLECLLGVLQQPGEVGWLGNAEVGWLIDNYPGPEREACLALITSPHPAAHGRAVAHLAALKAMDAEVRAALLAFLEVGTERARSFRVQAAVALYRGGERDAVLPILLGEKEGTSEWPALLVAQDARTVEAVVRGLLALGKGAIVEERLLTLLDHGHAVTARGWTDIEGQHATGERVDPEARQQGLALLLDQCRTPSVRQQARDRLTPGASRTHKLRTLARTFAWGVRLGRQLTGELFDLEMIAGEELGYTRLEQPKLFISPMPILRGEQDAREVVKGLILHEYGHHVYHKSPEAQKVWARAQKERMHPLLNLVSDEHLERNLRSRDEQYDELIKKLDAYAFQHAAREVNVAELLSGLGSHAFAVLTQTEMQAARTQGCVRLSAGGLLHRMERAGVSFARFMRALRMGLGNRHQDEKVGRGLALFKGAAFRQSSMERMYDIAKELRAIFGEETELLNCIGQDGVMCGGEDELIILGEGITNEELQRAVQRALEEPGDEEPEKGNPVRTINLGTKLDFPLIDLIQPQAFDPRKYARYARQVSKQASGLRQYLTQLGLALEPQRQRVQGKLVDRARIRGLVLRGDPRILIARQVQVRTDLFLGVVIDCSGSMAMGGNIEKAKLFSALLAEAARGLRGIDLRLWGFTDRRIFDCGDATRPAIHDLVASEGNNDAAALYHAAQVAKASRRRARLLVMISDGSPTECTVEALRNLVKQLTARQGYLCAQVAVRPLDHVCFPHYVLLQDNHVDACVKRFGMVIMRLVRQALG